MPVPPFWLKDIFTWWVVLFIGGVTFLPLTKKIFKNAPDAAYPFAKILALALISYPLWLLSSLKLLPFATSPVWLLLIPTFLTILLSVFHLPPSPPPNHPTTSGLPDHRTTRPQVLPLIIFEEFLFLLAFSFWLFVRAHEPSLQSLEKPMDFGIINSLLRSDSFPPKDMWLSGFNLNYYYYGHFVTALLIKLTGVLPEVGYNLMLAALFALTFTASFSFALNLYDKSQQVTTGNHKLPQIILPLLTAFGLSLFGNLHPLYAFIKGVGSYWYPDATRFIERTIHEFPSYSFVVADLHGHLLDVPFVLLTLLVIYQIWQDLTSQDHKTTRPQNHPTTRLRDHKTLLLGLLLAILYMTNSIDAVIYGGLFFLFLLLKNSQPFSVRNLWRPTLILLLLALTFASPFLLTFKPFIEGVSLAPERSPLWQLLILWGGFLPFALGFLFYFFQQVTRPHNHMTTRPQDSFLALLIIFSLLLILFPELFYFRDIYTTQPRANTLFKFSYQAFIVLSLITPYLFFRIINFWERSRVKKAVWLLIFLTVLAITGSYPLFAIRGFYGELNTPKTLTLNGLEYLRKTYPNDYQTVLWLKNNIKGQPVILEAVGESYTNFARISANTGLPTIFGWPVHEWLWRKGNHFAAAREPEIVTLYETKDLGRAQELLKKYKVRYVVVGQLERERYPNLYEEKFEKLGMLVFTAGNTHLYTIHETIL